MKFNINSTFLQIFFRLRLVTEECLDHRWLMLNAPMVKVRKAAIFATDKLKAFEEDYIQRRMAGSTPSDKLMHAYGAGISWSSDEEDDTLRTPFRY